MLNVIASLSSEEKQILLDAIPYITIYVAGADGNIDDKELKSSERLTKVRAFAFDEELRSFYQKIDENFEQRVQELLNALPQKVEDRQQEIVEKLKPINSILPKIDHFYARLYYKSLRSFADHVANASGGIMGWLSVGFEEYKVVDLHMIDPVE